MNAPPITIESLWLDYERGMIPITAGDMQRQQLRRALYAGFGSAYGILVVDMAKVPIGQQETLVTDLGQECANFAVEVQRGVM